MDTKKERKTKVCISCQRRKSVHLFYKNTYPKKTNGIVTIVKGRRPECKDCSFLIKEKNALRRQQNALLAESRMKNLITTTGA